MDFGQFITFEGGEGSGKSTQVKRLADRLSALDQTVTVTREPGGSPFAETLRALLLDAETPPHDALAEALVFYAARADHLSKTIRPALANGDWVLCDRFSDSTRVYQSFASSLPVSVCDQLDDIVVGETRPALTFVLDIIAEEGLARAHIRRHQGIADEDGNLVADRYEGRDLDYHRRLRDGFLKVAALDPERCIVIDATASQDEIASLIWSHVAKRFDLTDRTDG